MIRTAEAPGQVLPPQEVVLLAERRQEARCRSDWSESDALRQQLAALGWQVQDTKDGYKLTTA
jgi:cysteinyl-tRNA synthetase